MSSRVPPGVPTGGQFAASAKGESGVALGKSTGRAKAPKAFVQSSPPPMLPHAWAQAADITHHSRQGEALYFAATKKALAEMLTERGLSEYDTKSLTSRTRAETRDEAGMPYVGTYWQHLIDSGAVDMSKPGVYFAHRHSVDQPVFRVEPGGEVVTVAHWRRNPDTGRGAPHLIAEPTGE